jgi:hypothetical protein
MESTGKKINGGSRCTALKRKHPVEITVLQDAGVEGDMMPELIPINDHARSDCSGMYNEFALWQE